MAMQLWMLMGNMNPQFFRENGWREKGVRPDCWIMEDGQKLVQLQSHIRLPGNGLLPHECEQPNWFLGSLYMQQELSWHKSNKHHEVVDSWVHLGRKGRKDLFRCPLYYQATVNEHCKWLSCLSPDRPRPKAVALKERKERWLRDIFILPGFSTALGAEQPS